MIFLISLGKMLSHFPENMILLFRGKMKDHLSQEIQGYKIFSVHSGKMVFFSVKEEKMIFSRKNALKDGNTGIIDEDDIHPRK